MAAVRGTSSDVPVSLISRFTNLRTAATHSLGNELWQLFKLRSFAMCSMDPYEIWLFPQRDSQSRNSPPSTLSNRLSLIGGDK
jgi:hypothetical protein